VAFVINNTILYKIFITGYQYLYDLIHINDINLLNIGVINWQ